MKHLNKSFQSTFIRTDL